MELEKMPFTPTEEQLAVVSAARDTDANILVQALAGAAKTTTLVMIAEALENEQILCLAFNKRIAVEMNTKLPENATAFTLNAIGHRAWSDSIGKRLSINSSKVYDLLADEISKTHDRALRGELSTQFSDLLKIIGVGKSSGWIPNDFSHPYFNAKRRLLSDKEFFRNLPEELSAEAEDVVKAVSIRSVEQAIQGICDFDDQILMPTVFGGAFPRYKVVLVDEAQDLSPLNHAMLTRLVRGRLIAVGDSFQAIYGFRGASKNSMTLLKRQFNMQELWLSVSFRCPRTVADHVRWRAPMIKSPDWAKPGEVQRKNLWGAEDIPENAAVICRNNAPLFALAMKLLRNNRYAEIYGNDIGKGLLKIMAKLGEKSLPRETLLKEIDKWEAAKLEKTRAHGHSAIIDKASCMRVFAEATNNLSEALGYAQHIFEGQGPIKLMTGHKSKGLEFDNVFFLDDHLVSKKAQDPNLRYVIQTRAKETLTYIDLENFQDSA